jgi:hypothetical protein
MGNTEVFQNQSDHLKEIIEAFTSKSYFYKTKLQRIPRSGIRFLFLDKLYNEQDRKSDNDPRNDIRWEKIFTLIMSSSIVRTKKQKRKDEI